ncbi:MAG: type VI secretion system protein IglI family protein, partial [Planctomycetota bacterium]
MLEIQLLLNPLTQTENPGLDTLDPRFQEIAGFVEAGEFAKASEQTQALLKEGIADIRIISYFLYGVFLEVGLGGLGQMLQALGGLFGPNWAAIGPVQKKEKHAENGIGWLLARLTKKLKAEEEAKSPDWNKWVETVPATAVAEMLQRIGEVRAAMAVANSQKLADQLKSFEDWVKDFQKIAEAESQKAADAVAAAAPPPEAAAEAAAP